MARKAVVCLLAAALLLGVGTAPAWAQFGIGAEVPGMEVLGAYHVSDQMMVELRVPVGALGLVLSVAADGKLFFNDVAVGPLTLWPFAGAGLGVSFVNSVLASSLFLTPFVMVGTEYRFSQIPLSIFAELGLNVSLTSLGVGFGFSPGVGLRYDF